MISRRGLLGGLTGILTAGLAPAIVRNPMKIVVPHRKSKLASLIITDWTEVGWHEPQLDLANGGQMGYSPEVGLEHMLSELRSKMAWDRYVNSGYPAPRGFLAGGMA